MILPGTPLLLQTDVVAPIPVRRLLTIYDHISVPPTATWVTHLILYSPLHHMRFTVSYSTSVQFIYGLYYVNDAPVHSRDFLCTPIVINWTQVLPTVSTRFNPGYMAVDNPEPRQSTQDVTQAVTSATSKWRTFKA